MPESYLYTLLLAACFLTLFGSAEVLYRVFKVRAELTRKYVHMVTGFLTLLFPIWVNDVWLVLALCGSFAVILLASLKWDLLPSINAIDRQSRGSLLYPLVVFICYLSYHHYQEYQFFYIPILIMAVADPLAALAGKRWPWLPYKVGKETKTMLGSTVFFLAAFVVAFSLFYLLQEKISPFDFLFSLGLALVATLAEGVSRKGYDNLLIPLSTLTLMIIFREWLSFL